ncbi:MAG: hypothetical protein R2855_09750 [Thermomicrobiales bacterium]
MIAQVVGSTSAPDIYVTKLTFDGNYEYSFLNDTYLYQFSGPYETVWALTYYDNQGQIFGTARAAHL